jgi:hypothetical protein
MGTVKLPVPVKRSGENFSPMPFCAPPPLGREMTEAFDLLLIAPPTQREEFVFVRKSHFARLLSIDTAIAPKHTQLFEKS